MYSRLSAIAPPIRSDRAATGAYAYGRTHLRPRPATVKSRNSTIISLSISLFHFARETRVSRVEISCPRVTRFITYRSLLRRA
jgi:hypothetical protein